MHKFFHDLLRVALRVSLEEHIYPLRYKEIPGFTREDFVSLAFGVRERVVAAKLHPSVVI